MAPHLTVGEIFASGPSSAVAALVGFTGLLGGAGRYGAVLAKRTDPGVEQATAIGFFSGLAIGCIALLIESVL